MKSIVLNLIFFMPVFAFSGIPLPEHPRPDWERESSIHSGSRSDF